MTARRTSMMFFAAFLFAPALAADDWPAATVKEVASENGRRMVVIIPGESIGETVGFASAPKGKWATAELYARSDERPFAALAVVKLRNPVAPVDVLVSDSGAFITLDNWHNVGYGEVVAVYDGDGELVKSYRLEQLFPDDEIAKIRLSTSSRWWRCDNAEFVDLETQTEASVLDFRGGRFVFDMKTGAVTYEPGNPPCNVP